MTTTTLPAGLSFYKNVQNIFELVRREPEKRIEYNLIGKHVIIFDRFANGIKSTVVNLCSLSVSEVELEKRQRRRV